MTGYRGETYYGRPALKPARYGWLVVGYLLTGGTAGGAGVIGALAGDSPTGRAARRVALAGVALAPLPLIKDLHFPRRWYNMLRIARPTSPMSIGSWTLTAFGGVATLAVGADVLRASGPRRVIAVPAAALGAVLCVYTGSLLAATATPVWSSAPRLLPVLFGSSAMSTAAAAVELTSRADLTEVAIASTAVEAVALEATAEAWREAGVAGPLEEPRLRSAHRAARGLAMVAVGLRVAALVSGSTRVRRAGALAALGSAVAMRALVVFAGQRSALRPADYLGQAEAARGAATAASGPRASRTRSPAPTI